MEAFFDQLAKFEITNTRNRVSFSIPLPKQSLGTIRKSLSNNRELKLCRL